MISIIAAVADNGVIGADGTMPWRIAEDLRRFRELTWGHGVVMGRRTFESIGRPLDGRVNVVLSRMADYAPEGAAVALSLEQAVAMFAPDEEVFVAGGGDVYRRAMAVADRIYLTRVGGEWRGDVVFPAIDPALWRVVRREVHSRGVDFPYPFEFIDYERAGC